MAMFKVRREIISLAEGVVEAETPTEAHDKIRNGKWEYGRTTVESDKIISCDLLEVVEETPNPKDS